MRRFDRWLPALRAGLLVTPLWGGAAAQEGEPVPWASHERDVPGETVWLEVPGERFAALYAPASSEPPLGAVLIAHGLGRHADFGLVRRLRVGLAAGGWHTLSVQLPVPTSDTPIHDQVDLPARVVARLAAGHAYLSAQGIPNVALVGHRWGAGVAALYLQSGVPQGVTGYVALAPAFSSPGPTLAGVSEILAVRELPVLVVESVGPPVAEPARTLTRPSKVDAPRRRIVIDTVDESLADSAAGVTRRLLAWLVRNAQPPPE